MYNNIDTLAKGATGAGLVQVASTVPVESIGNAGQLIIQIVIGIVTLWKLLKKPKVA